VEAGPFFDPVTGVRASRSTPNFDVVATVVSILMGSHTMGLFAFGMAGTTVLITLFWRDVLYPRSLAVLGGVWAVIPQLVTEVPYIGPQLSWIQGHPVANVFWFNHLIEYTLRPEGGSVSQHRFTAAVIALLIVTLVWAEWREYQTVTAGTSVTDPDE
jgi:hypothetical protein